MPRRPFPRAAPSESSSLPTPWSTADSAAQPDTDPSSLDPVDSVELDDSEIPYTTTTEDDLEALLPSDKSAKAIKVHLDRFVIGQEDAKRQLSALLSIHLTWFSRNDRLNRTPNAILIGPSGVGKTHSIRTAAEYLSLPYVIVDSSSLVPVGAKRGQPVQDILVDLVVSARELLTARLGDYSEGADIDLAGRGVIFLDEFDKMRGQPEFEAGDVWNQMVQRQLLKIVEGSKVTLPDRDGLFMDSTSLDTSGILFIASGAFAGIHAPDILAKRPVRSRRQDPNRIVPVDLQAYGFIPELIARLPVLIEYGPLTEGQLLEILETETVNPSHIWSTHLLAIGIDLDINAGARKFLSSRATELGLGARGLYAVLFPIMATLLFELEAKRPGTFELTEELCRTALDRIEPATDSLTGPAQP